MSEEPRIAVIMALDVVGFSKSMHADMQATVEHVTGLRDGLWSQTMAAHGGRIFKHTGDGFLARFNGARAAFQAARELLEGNSNEKFPVRIGIHLGDVFEKHDDLYGDAVNIACRIESVSPTNSVCVSERVWSDLDNRDTDFALLRKIKLKNISTDIKIYQYQPSQTKFAYWMSRAKRTFSPTAIVLTVTALLAVGAVVASLYRPEATKEVTTEDRVAQLIDSLPCSWLRLSDMEASESRQRVVLKGYSQVETDRLKRLIEMRIAEDGNRNVQLDLRGTSRPPAYACSFIETANRFRYKGLARVSLLSVEEADKFDTSLTFKSGIDLKTVMANSDFGSHVMLIEVFGNDFSKAAEFFTIETDGTVKALGNLHEMAELLQVNEMSDKDKLVLAWPASTRDNILFIIDSKKPFSAKSVEEAVDKDWTEFNRLAQEKGFTIEMAVVPDGAAAIGGPTTGT
ncbi:Adenylate and Guanylate cyclase catalytic domain protein [Tsuneonella dongtanensis]|uniref:Adenylate and Guanylate cyclase catalytic domain protein n=1 Tax=Tsuneonella dongtanensis TaxID=692370 RepID=A0A1B2ABI1_9SPHN|nr:adenylate/guanylate cyclase domain-containing protein [Tsuneonella dongtanensis]ANY19461.1 Adenylate and Guanylate cyclase catalytic domain protein [Tsuneonella dongtanensis]